MAATLGWRLSAGNGGSHGNNELERNSEGKFQDSEPPTPKSVSKMGLRDHRTSSMEDPDGTLASVAQCIEQLRQNSSTAQEKEYTLRNVVNAY